MLFARPLTELFAGGYRGPPGRVRADRRADARRLSVHLLHGHGGARHGARSTPSGGSPSRRSRPGCSTSRSSPRRSPAAVSSPPGRPVLRARARRARGRAAAGGRAVAGAAPSRLRGSPARSTSDDGVRDVLRRIAPMTFGIGIYYVDLVLSRRFLSELGTGAQSYFSWAMRLCDFPQGIFVMALSTAALPSLATLAAKGETGELARTFAHGMRPGDVRGDPRERRVRGVGEPIVVLLFQRGAFDAAAARGDGAGARLARGGHLDGGRRPADGAGVLRARRHADARHRERARSLRVHRARRRAPGADGPRRHQRRRRGIERRADGAAARGRCGGGSGRSRAAALARSTAPHARRVRRRGRRRVGRGCSPSRRGVGGGRRACAARVWRRAARSGRLPARRVGSARAASWPTSLASRRDVACAA